MVNFMDTSKRLFISALLGFLMFQCNPKPIQKAQEEAVYLDGDTLSSRTKMPVLPELTPLPNDAKTKFLITLDEPVQAGNNLVYSAAFPEAWSELLKAIGGSIKGAPQNSETTKRLMTTRYHEGVLTEKDYTKNIRRENGIAEVQVSIKFMLPFDKGFEGLTYGYDFQNKQVEGFEGNLSVEGFPKLCSILYYKNDKEFCVQINPKDSSIKMLLVKGLPAQNTFLKNWELVETWKKRGVNFAKRDSTKWRTEWRGYDYVRMPNLGFNFKYLVKEVLHNQLVKDGKDTWTIQKAEISNGFALNENGSVLVSLAKVLADTTAKRDPEDIKPIVIPNKYLDFNDAFHIILIREGAPYPFFMVYVANSDFMQSYKGE